MLTGIRRFFSDLSALLRSHRKGLLLTAGGGFAVFVAFVGFVANQSVKPEFCRTCHIMEPYYQSWKHSSHNQVDCLLCHFKPGVRGFLRGRVVALSQFVRYVTVTYGSKPWTEIEDASCLRSGCHDNKLLAGPMGFQKGVFFDHSHHLSTLKRGKQLRCTSCHSQIVQGRHMMVTEEVCFICHFKPEPNGGHDPVLSDCRKCHRKGLTTAKTPAEHALFIERGTDCSKCHIAVTRGNGEVPHRRCEACHNNPDQLAVTDPQLLHQSHVTDHKVECFLCHEPIVHKMEKPNEITERECGVCHAERHQIQKAFYQGAANVPFALALPSPMIEAHIDCTACHAEMVPTDGGYTTVTKAVAHASSTTCVECHGQGYDNLLLDWQREIQRRVTQTQVLARVEGAIETAAAPTSGTTLARKVDQTLAIINAAKAVHNIGYTATLIEHCQRTLLEATSQTAAGPVMRDWVRNELPSFRNAPSCLQQCHYGITEKTIFLKNQNRDFPHASHVGRAGLDCGTCHSREQHKVSLPRGYDCNACHHKDAQGKTCAECHQEIVAFAEGKYAGLELPNPPALKCDSCHTGTGGKIALLNTDLCSQCHADTKAYQAKLEQQRKTLKQLETEVRRGFQAATNQLELKGLETAVQVQMVERVNGIHNFALSEKILQSAKEYLKKRP